MGKKKKTQNSKLRVILLGFRNKKVISKGLKAFERKTRKK